MGKTVKRRKYFIKKEYQGKLLLGGFLFVAAIALLFNVVLGLLSADTLTISYTNQELQLGQTPAMLFKQVVTANWLLILLGGGFVIIASLLLSHRVVGPMYRFEKTLEKMKDGSIDSVIKLRDKDEGKELAEKINEFNGQLSSSIKEIGYSSNALDILIGQVAEIELPEAQKEQLASLCWSMQEHNRKISARCNFFTIKE